MDQNAAGVRLGETKFQKEVNCMEVNWYPASEFSLRHLPNPGTELEAKNPGFAPLEHQLLSEKDTSKTCRAMEIKLDTWKDQKEKVELSLSHGRFSP